MWNMHAPTFDKWHKKKKKKKVALHILTHGAMQGCGLTSLVVCINDKIHDVRERKVTIRSEIWTMNICSLGLWDIREWVTLWGLLLWSLGCTNLPPLLRFGFQVIKMDTYMWLDSDDSSNDEILEELEDEFKVFYTMVAICANTWKFFNPNELKYGGQGAVDHNRGVHDVILLMRAIPENFKTLTNFTLPEFDELCGLVMPMIASHALFRGEVHKLSHHVTSCPQQWLFIFFPYMEIMMSQKLWCLLVELVSIGLDWWSFVHIFLH